jgi:peptidoglycan/xylan/chitin deacetylase (PgdA/CDA1 family)
MIQVDGGIASGSVVDRTRRFGHRPSSHCAHPGDPRSSAAGMRLIDVIRGPSRPTQVQLRHRRRRAGALIVLACVALLLGLIAGASGGGSGSTDARAATKVGWYGHLSTLAGAGRSSLDFEQRTQESAAIDRALQITPFVRMGGDQHRLVALTFDDGPGPYTNRLIDELQRLRVPATFFVVGYQLPEFATTLQREVDLGLVIGDHSADHANLAQLGRDGQREQIDSAADEISSFGAPQPRLFRPPYGSYDQTTHDLLGRRQMLSVLWSVDSQDYTQPGVDAIVQNVVDNVHPGAIVLMHDAGGVRTQTLAALPLIVRQLRRDGYRFVSVPRLLLENPPPQDQQLPAGFNSANAG